MPRPKLSVISTAALQAELQKRMSGLAKLIVQRDDLDRQIAELQGASAPAAVVPVAVTPVKTKGKKRGRKPGPKAAAVAMKPAARRAAGKTLAEYVKEALASGSKGIKDIEKAVLASGYPTRAQNIYNQVATVLGKPAFKRVEKGVYALRSAVKAGFASATAALPKSKGKRAKFAQTAQEFVLSLAKGKGATTAEINKAWKAAGRGGTADTTLGEQVKAGKLTRKKLSKGSLYRLA